MIAQSLSRSLIDASAISLLPGELPRYNPVELASMI
jgi:hypothetical protein